MATTDSSDPIKDLSDKDFRNFEEKFVEGFKPEGKYNVNDLRNYIKYRFAQYKRANLLDHDLLFAFHSNFSEFEQIHFNQLDVVQVLQYRKELRIRGIFVDLHESGHKALFNTSRKEQYESWTVEQIQEAFDDANFNFISGTVLRFMRRNNITRSPQPNIAQPVPIRNLYQGILPSISSSQATGANATPLGGAPPQPGTTLGFPPVVHPPQAGFPPVAQLGFPPAPPPQLGYPPATLPGYASAGPNPYHALTAMQKAYDKDELKYSGTDDSLNRKLKMFYNNCQRFQLPQTMIEAAFPSVLTGSALAFYHTNIGRWQTFEALLAMLQAHFEGPEQRFATQAKWEDLSMTTITNKNPGKPLSDCLPLLFNEIQEISYRLPSEQQTDITLRDKLFKICRVIPQCQGACQKPVDTFIGLQADLRSCVATWEKCHTGQDSFLTERTYHGNDRGRLPYKSRYQSPTRQPYGPSYQRPSSPAFNRPYNPSRPYSPNGPYSPNRRFSSRHSSPNRSPNGRSSSGSKGPYHVCRREGCHSFNHTNEERNEATKKYRENLRIKNDRQMDQYILEMNTQSNSTITDKADHHFTDIETDEGNDQFHTSIGSKIDGNEVVRDLAKRAFIYAITTTTSTASSVSRYSEHEFQGVIIDTGAAAKSTAGYNQFLALKNIIQIDLNTITAGGVIIRFGIGTAAFIGSIRVNLPVGEVEFHVMKTDTPFLLSLADQARFKIYYRVPKNVIVQETDYGSVEYPALIKFGHAFFEWYNTKTTQFCFLTENDLKRLHKRFGHPAAHRLQRLLQRSGHDDFDPKTIEKLTKYCRDCQMNGKSPGRFKFTLHDDVEYNYCVYVDIFYIDGKPVLHVVDEATRYQAATWLKDISAKHVWEKLRYCWIDMYVGPPDYIIHDAGTQFISKEFKQFSASMAISTKAVPTEAHWSIGIVERYHKPIARAYTIISKDLMNESLSKEMMLQMAVKAVNDTAGPDGLVPTLLVYGAYPRISDDDAPTPSMTLRATTVRKAMTEVMKLRAQRQVSDALKERNGPSTSAIHDLPLNSEVRVWRKANPTVKGEWVPGRLVSIDSETCEVMMENGKTSKFRSTTVKPLLQEPIEDLEEPVVLERQEPAVPERRIARFASDDTIRVEIPRPSSIPPPEEPRRLLRSHHQHFIENQPVPGPSISAFFQGDTDETFASDNTSPLFIASRRKEIDGLMDKGTFQIVQRAEIPEGTRIFKSRFVDEIKEAGTNKAFEKSRLVVQAYDDSGKLSVLTQSPTIQRSSQRVIIAIYATFSKTKNLGLYLRDITQAYIQSKSQLQRLFFIIPPAEMELGPDVVLKVCKPLYGIPEAGNHWFSTYHGHHEKKLQMTPSTYDPCLLHTNKSNTGFGIVGLQTDDTLFAGDPKFATIKQEKLKEASFTAKPREELTLSTPLKFNGGVITQSGTSIRLNQEKQVTFLRLITNQTEDLTGSRGKVRKNATPKDQYIAQRARGAYIATVCQPEASFDLSFAAQVVNPKDDDTKALNKRIQWQQDNATRGLTFVPLDTESLRLIVFTDASFANNNDLSSQIGYVIVLSDKDDNANILHWSSVKCKRITRSILASELYALVLGFDVASALKSTIDNILTPVKIPLIACTDSKSLYECIVKLGTTQEKRLMIDILALRQGYERREIAEMRWIDGDTNPADAMTKTKCCQALTNLIDTNKYELKSTQWVERNDETIG